METLKKYLFWISITVLTISSIFFFKGLFKGKNPDIRTYEINDTNLRYRIDREIKKDTIIKWYEKFYKTNSEPKVVYVQKTDTIYFERIKDLDFMIKMEKSGKNLTIYAVNPEGKILKEYIFTDIYNNFSVTSKKNDIYVKSNNFHWNKLNIVANHQFIKNENALETFSIGIETGITYKDKIELNSGIFFSPKEKTFFSNTNLKIKF